MQKPSNELIEKFFKSLCTEEEAASVLQYLKANPDHPYLLKAWEEADGKTALPENYTQQMFDTVNGVIAKPQQKTTRLFGRFAAAASIAVIVFSIWVISKKNVPSPALAAADTLSKTEWTTKYNTLDKQLTIKLNDSSEVTLSPNASIRYHDDFNSHSKREIYMRGQAFFRVAKNKQKPFIVYSQGLSTTALGTAFRVTENESDKALKVALFEGKVVVALTDTAYERPAGNYYLLPGQELVFNTKKRQGLVHSFFKKNNTVKGNKSPQQQSADESYMFNNQTLADVLDQLSAIYNIKIQYSKSDIGSNYFIGKIEREDPVEKIIHDIALLNKLTVTKQNGGYVLKRKY